MQWIFFNVQNFNLYLILFICSAIIKQRVTFKINSLMFSFNFVCIVACTYMHVYMYIYVFMYVYMYYIGIVYSTSHTESKRRCEIACSCSLTWFQWQAANSTKHSQCIKAFPLIKLFSRAGSVITNIESKKTSL